MLSKKLYSHKLNDIYVVTQCVEWRKITSSDLAKRQHHLQIFSKMALASKTNKNAMETSEKTSLKMEINNFFPH